MLHISQLDNMESGQLENMERGQLSNDRYYDIIQIHIPKGYTLPIELLNLTPPEWKDLLNKAAKLHIDNIIKSSLPLEQLNDNLNTDYDSKQQIAEYHCMGQTNKIHPLDKYHLDKTHIVANPSVANQDALNPSVTNQDGPNNLYEDLTQSYKSLQCVIC